MASKKALAHRLFTASNRFLFNNSALESGDSRIFRRFLHRTPANNNSNSRHPSTFTRPVLPPFPGRIGNVMEQLAGIISRERIQLDGLSPPPSPPSPPPGNLEGLLTVEETRKLVRLTEVVRLKRKLKEVHRSWITYREFVRICEEDCLDGDRDYGVELARRLDDSGAVIVLGNFVFLDPEQMAKSIACLIPTQGTISNQDDPRTCKELEEMEKQKAIIDVEANHQVRRELRFGLGFLVAQTAMLMRLTFWELTWDVMEPICYFITSTYFMGGYAFFLSTSKEPSFEGLYHSRFVAKQKHLMKLHNFDVDRYNRLLRDSKHLASSNYQYA